MARTLGVSLVALFVISMAFAWAGGTADEDKTMEGSALWPPDKIEWKDGPASLPPGARMAVLEGDPTKEGPFVMRIQLPDGYRVPPHIHLKTERITVISGTFFLGMGEKFDTGAADRMPAGSYGYWAAGMKHFVWVEGETVLQLHGTGPWTIEYVDPADDPRKARK